MRKITFLILSMILIGCSSEIEKRADRHLKAIVKEVTYFPESVKIGKIEKVWQAKNDSSAIFHFEVEARLKNGTLDKSYCEYVYLMDKDCDREVLIDLSKKESVIQQAKDGKKDVESTVKDNEAELGLDDYIGLYAMANVFMAGRRVPKE